MRILVCGGRDYTDWERFHEELNHILDEYFCDDVVIIEGGARGADTMAREFAQKYGLEWIEYKADWDRYLKAAGLIRNKEMLGQGKPDLVVAFPGGKGTAHMVKLAKEAGVEVIEIV